MRFMGISNTKHIQTRKGRGVKRRISFTACDRFSTSLAREQMLYTAAGRTALFSSWTWTAATVTLGIFHTNIRVLFQVNNEATSNLDYYHNVL